METQGSFYTDMRGQITSLILATCFFFHSNNFYTIRVYFLIYIYMCVCVCDQRPKSFMQRPWYGELLKAIIWFDGEVERCFFVFRSHLGLCSNLVCINSVFVGCESSGSKKAQSTVRTSVWLTTELAPKTRWKAEAMLDKQSFTCLLILPNEFR